MIIGVPKEIKNNESRVGMTPSGVFELVKNNHSVYVQKDAGFGSGFFDCKATKSNFPSCLSEFSLLNCVPKLLFLSL